MTNHSWTNWSKALVNLCITCTKETFYSINYVHHYKSCRYITYFKILHCAIWKCCVGISEAKLYNVYFVYIGICIFIFKCVRVRVFRLYKKYITNKLSNWIYISSIPWKCQPCSHFFLLIIGPFPLFFLLTIGMNHTFLLNFSIFIYISHILFLNNHRPFFAYTYNRKKHHYEICVNIH